MMAVFLINISWLKHQSLVKLSVSVIPSTSTRLTWVSSSSRGQKPSMVLCKWSGRRWGWMWRWWHLVRDSQWQHYKGISHGETFRFFQSLGWRCRKSRAPNSLMMWFFCGLNKIDAHCP
ncbi:hypothetical protein NMG60_11009466 [Bertholletia excelsa]